MTMLCLKLRLVELLHKQDGGDSSWIEYQMTISCLCIMYPSEVFCNIIHFIKIKNNTWVLTMTLLYFKFCIVELLRKCDGSDLTWIKDQMTSSGFNVMQHINVSLDNDAFRQNLKLYVNICRLPSGEYLNGALVVICTGALKLLLESRP